MGEFYVYEHWRPDTATCFYVGKGKDGRAFDKKYNRNKHYLNIVAKLSRLGLLVDIQFVAMNLSEDDAFNLEKERISYWREKKIKLTNLTNGGDGSAGHIQPPLTDEQRQKLVVALKRAALNRLPMDDPTKSKISATVEALWRDEEYRQRLSEAHKGHVFTEEHRAALRAGQAARAPRTEEHKARIAAAVKAAHERKRLANGGKETMPPGTGAKISASNLGKKRSPEACERIRGGVTASWTARKAVENLI